MKAVAAGVGLLLTPVLLLALLAGGLGAPQAAASAGSPGGPLRAGSVPAELVPHFVKAAAMCPELTPALLAAQVAQESGFRNVTSPVGAQGYAQFMPATWASVGRDHNGDGVANVLDPADAIPSQGAYMCQLIAQIKGWQASGKVNPKADLITLALTAYNGGPGVVLRYGGPIPGNRESEGYAPAVLARVAQYTALAGPAGTGAFANPLGTQTYVITSRPGPRGAPCAGCSTNHKGLDMAGPSGQTVFSACSGIVARVADLTGMGQLTVVDCSGAGGVRMYYAHQSSRSVVVGQSVRAGAVIGKTGNTGRSSGPHLHFELHTGAGAALFSGQVEDPVAWMATKGVTL